MSNALNLVVRFNAIDKLSGGLRKITSAGKIAKETIKKLSDENRGLKKELKEVELALKKAGDSATAEMIAKQRDLKAAIEGVNGKLAGQHQLLGRMAKIKAFGEGMKSVGTKMSIGVTAPLTLLGRAAFMAASDFTELNDAFGVTFGPNADAMRKWAEDNGKVLERSRREMMGMAMSYQDLLGKQMDPAKAMEMSKSLTLLTQDLASFKNLSNADAQAKIFSGLIGEAEPLRAVGVLLSDAAVKAKLAAMGFKKSAGEYTEGQKVLARAALIQEQLKNAEGNVVQTKDSPANRMKAAAAAADDAQVSLGQKLLPALTPLINVVVDLLNSFNGLSPGMQKAIVVFAVVVAAVGPVIAILGAVVGIVGTIGLAAAGMVAAVLGIGIAIAAIAYVIYANWDTIKAAFANGWQSIKNLLGGAPAWMKAIGGAMMSGLIAMLSPGQLISHLIWVAKQGMAAFRNYMGIKSPSRLMMQMGGHIATGLAMGIDRGGARPLRSMGKLATGVAGAGAMALTGPTLATAAPRGGAAPAAPITIQISQQPGEDANALADRVVARLEEARRRQQRSSFGDDF